MGSQGRDGRRGKWRVAVGGVVVSGGEDRWGGWGGGGRWWKVGGWGRDSIEN